MITASFYRWTTRLAAVGLALTGVVATPQSASAAEVNLGYAGQFAILAVNNPTLGGSLTINSANTVSGNVGVTNGVTTDIQKIGAEGNGGGADVWNGALLSYSSSLGYTPKNTDPGQGFYAPATLTPAPETAPGYMGATYNGMNVQTYLNQANADAFAADTFLQGKSFTSQSVAADSTINGGGGWNYINITNTINFNSNTLTLKGTAADVFVFKYTGSTFDFSQSQILLDGINAKQILWWFPTATAIVINKDSTVWNGTILATNLTTDLIYHNPATFNGAIIANKIDVHSDFNLNYVPFVPLPAAVWLLLSGLAGLGLVARRKTA